MSDSKRKRKNRPECRDGLEKKTEKKVKQKSTLEKGKQKEQEEKQDEFQCRLVLYFRVIQATSGCGSRGQKFIDKAHQALINYAAKHPECAHLVPREASICKEQQLNVPKGAMKAFVCNRLANMQ